MTAKEKTSSDNKKYDRIFAGIIEILLSFYKLTKIGIRTKFYKQKENLVITTSFIFLFAILVYKKRHLQLIGIIPFEFMQTPTATLVNSIEPIWTIILSTVFVVLVSIWLAGQRGYKLLLKYQRALDHLNLKSGLDHRPTVVNVDSREESRTRILVKSTGLGEERYKTKLDDLRSAVGQRVESVCYNEKDNRFIEISLSTKLLEEKVNYADLMGHLKRPYSFMIGKSQKKVVTENLEDVPHYLIAGSTGGGKS